MLKKVSLGVKLTGGFVIAAAVALAIGIIGYQGLMFATRAQNEIATRRLPGVHALGRIAMALPEIQRSERTLLFPTLSKEAAAREKESMSESLGEAENGIKVYDPLPRTAEEDAIWTEFKAAWAEWKKEHEAMAQRLGKGAADERNTILEYSLGSGGKLFSGADERIEKLVSLNMGYAAAAGKEFDRGAKATKILAVSSVFLGVAVPLLLGIALSRSIARSLNTAAVSLAEGATQVASAATQLSSSSQSLAEGSSEQAASLEETASAMEEMSAMTRRNTESAGQAKILSDAAGASVDKANASMNRLVGQMSEISSMGEEIGKIIRTIDEIAFQTNLLALNAAVEAARAGEAGAGFAVVADEVRNLAQRAAGAARNTSELIEGSIRKIKDGTELVEKTNADFSEVTSSVKKVTELVTEVSAASEEQARGIGEVSTAVSQMDKVTQDNAASAEEIAAASEELNAQAVTLQGIVGGLRTLVGGAESTAPAANAAPPKPAADDRRYPAATGKTPTPALSPANVPADRKGGNGKGNGSVRMRAEEAIPLEKH